MIRVLVVDDDKTFRASLTSMFHKWGRGAFALDVIDDLPDEPGDFLTSSDPQVILLDLGLRNSRGAETVRRAAELWPDKPIIVVTAEDVNGQSDAWRAAGATNVFNKLDISQERGFTVLLRAMRRTLGMRGDTKAEVTLSETIHYVESVPSLRKLRAWGTAALTALAGGGGGLAFFHGDGEAHVTHERFETREHAKETAASVRERFDDLREVVQKIDERTERTAHVVDRLDGYLNRHGH